MNESPHARRTRLALRAAIAGFAVLGLGVFALWSEARLAAPPAAEGPVVPGWSEAAGEAARIRVEAGEFRLLLAREVGENGAIWRAEGRGGYPVAPERIAALDAALSGLVRVRAMTRDPDKLARLGLADPGRPGGGVRVAVRDAGGETLADVVFGDRTQAGRYVRTAGGARAFLADGETPELGDLTQWLDLDVLSLEPEAIARAEVMPETGPPYRLVKPSPGARHFEVAEPEGRRLITAGAANGVGVAAARLRFRDVKPRAALSGEIVARHAATTFSGLGVILAFHREPDGSRWAALEFRALTQDAERRAARFNGQVEGWAYRLSEDAYERLTRPLAAFSDAADQG